MIRAARLSLCLLLCLAAPLMAQTFDEDTGLSTRREVPSPQVDFTHMLIDLRMPDPASRSFTATETLTFTTLGLPISSMRLDAVGFEIKSVKSPKGDVDFRHDGEELTLRFSKAFEPNSEHTIIIEYEVRNPVSGMQFAIPDEAYPDRPLHVHTQGQPEQNRHWFVSHDYPNERMTTEMKVTVPAELKVLANGERLETVDAGEGMSTWHYRMNKPHVSYLVSVVIGEFDVVEDEAWRGKRVEYWVPPGKADDAKATYGRTHNMLDFFSDKLGEYPWEAYSQSAVYLFGSGGMENTTVTTLYEDAVLDDRALIGNNIDGLIAHELAHQWFGDHTTCEDWSHLWLNEGFATYLDHAWHEHYYGADEYAHQVFTNMRSNAARDSVQADGGLVFPYYDSASETFRRGPSNPYGKGSAVIHMLRQFTGNDQAFWDALKLFQTRHGLSSVDSDDLQECFEEITGKSYTEFFEQWVYRTGTPSLNIDYGWNDDNSAVELTIRQTQPIAAAHPAYEHALPVWCVMEGGEIRKFTVNLNGSRTNATLATDEEPAMVIIDPMASLISNTTFRPPLAMTIRQAIEGPTGFAKLDAIERLGETSDDRALETLVAILTNNELHWGLRSEAARSVGRMDTAAAREVLAATLKQGVDEPRVRSAAISALGDYRHSSVVEALMPFAREDESLYVEAAALGALGNQDATDETIALLVEKAGDTGWALRVQQAAIGSLARLGAVEGVEPAMKLADYGGSFRARGTGISALGTLYPSVDEEQQTAIRELLVKLIDDPMDRHAQAAIRTLGSLGDEEAIAPLQRLADSARPEEFRSAARDAIESIGDGQDRDTLVRDLRNRLRRLEETRDAADGEMREKAEEATPTTPTTPTTQPAE